MSPADGGCAAVDTGVAFDVPVAEVKRRNARVRGWRTFTLRDLTRVAAREQAMADAVEYAAELREVDRWPQTFGECQAAGLGRERACPHLRCIHHLGVDVGASGSLRIARPGPDGLPRTDGPSCALVEAMTPSAADEGLRDESYARTLEEIAQALGVTRERVRQIVDTVLARIADERTELSDTEERR